MATNHESIRLTNEQIRLLDDLCVRTGRPAADLLAEALRAFQAEELQASNDAPNETLFDRLSRNGLLGCLSGGPADLSTNPEHMKGFGK